MNLKKRSFLTLLDYTKEEMLYLLHLASQLKTEKKNGVEKQYLKGKNIALIFEKDSTRTRCAFEVATYDQGGHVTYLGPTGSQIGKKESIKDTARVLGSMFDGIQYRGFSQNTVEILAKHSGVPVWNGLTDKDHPTQVLADFLTAHEQLNKPYDNITYAYLGDGHNNVAQALLIGCAVMGCDVRIISPKHLQPDAALVKRCQQKAAQSGGNITLTDDIKKGVYQADVIYTDVWVSMGENESIWKKRIEDLMPYQVTKEVLALTKNPNVIFEHCLPAFHNIETKVGKQIYETFGIKELEVTEEVFESKQSVVFFEAENRLHTIKAVMVATLGDEN